MRIHGGKESGATGGTMRRTLRAAAAAIAMAAVLAGASGCSAVKKSNRVSTGPTNSSPAGAPSSAAAGEPSPSGQVTQAAFNEDGDGARLVVSADAPLLYTSYEPRPDLLVVDLPGVRTAEGFTGPQATGTLVQSVRVETLDEPGKQVTRLSVEHRPGLKYELRSVGRGLAVAFEAPREASAETAPVPAPPTVVTEPIAPPALVRAELAHSLEEVTTEAAGEGLAVHLLGDGNLQAKDFVLANPPRIVIDLPGVKNGVRRKVLPVKGDSVSRVRVSQFQSAPEPITRIVLDLVRPTPYSVHVDGERLSVVVGGSEAAAAARTAPEAPPVVVAEVLPPPAPTPEEKPAETAPAPSRTEIVSPPPAAATPPTEPQQAPAAALSSPVPAPTDAIPEPAVRRPEPAAVNLLPPGIREARRSRPKETAEKPEKPANKGDALFEAAAAVLAQQEQTQANELTAFQSRTLAEGQTQFTGEPISLDLKDADIKDVFRT
ncbi:MAG TPA: AMIN domain-containing protein, partial [Thermoanaerobaculia bacterium]|nr:AMIN domain-containing protein [Thermoanaerobaculia bacterium]